MLNRVDINCDMGEGFGPYTIGQDDEMLSIACQPGVRISCGRLRHHG
jgi:UPF0271 protein